MNNTALHYAKYLINANKALVERTAIKNCHAIGLNSFIINETPKIRLFTCDENCELYKSNLLNPIIPIHSHKYDDIFTQINGNLIHDFWCISDERKGVLFNKYRYYRLSDNENIIENIGEQYLSHHHSYVMFCDMFLDAKILHSVRIKGDKVCWFITEMNCLDDFEPVGYAKKLLKRRRRLYQKFEEPLNYLNEFLNSLEN